eukprot:6206318-Pleurochrysis_carterae.AAC.2
MFDVKAALTSAFCKLKYRDRRSTEISISGDSYFEVLLGIYTEYSWVIAKHPASGVIDRISHWKQSSTYLAVQDAGTCAFFVGSLVGVQSGKCGEASEASGKPRFSATAERHADDASEFART